MSINILVCHIKGRFILWIILNGYNDQPLLFFFKRNICCLCLRNIAASGLIAIFGDGKYYWQAPIGRLIQSAYIYSPTLGIPKPILYNYKWYQEFLATWCCNDEMKLKRWWKFLFHWFWKLQRISLHKVITTKLRNSKTYWATRAIRLSSLWSFSQNNLFSISFTLLEKM